MHWHQPVAVSDINPALNTSAILGGQIDTVIDAARESSCREDVLAEPDHREHRDVGHPSLA
jgi:hypothetical protein